jgi:hypothetical protein
MKRWTPERAAERYLRQVRRQVEAECVAGMTVEELDGVWWVDRDGAHFGGPFASNADACDWLDRKGLG